jgi:hypothetical protein
MKWYAMILVTMAVLVSQASAQQNAPQAGAIVVKEPVFQTNGPYKVQEMMVPSLARHTVYRPIDLKAVKGRPGLRALQGSRMGGEKEEHKVSRWIGIEDAAAHG